MPDDTTSIIDRNEDWKKYYKVAKEEPEAIIALVAQQTDKIVKDLDQHKKTPVDKAHPRPESNPILREGITGKFTFTAKTWIKIIIVFALITTGGAAWHYLGPLLGG